ncbi:hypothetical protein CEE37_08580 [candidate division LCP-89 bacterium B3_LCP]|uniref:Uncharacterized protein n=1 Tax=candidate division LCP-89 bacterium B3_LCP TaxID=2012998 RepID=A0A532UZI9_UNCL8|nr:MAG: hypothetical protein CEE37_08580 [candidate division LCP-89 bacterium B3_LCP]
MHCDQPSTLAISLKRMYTGLARPIRSINKQATPQLCCGLVLTDPPLEKRGAFWFLLFTGWNPASAGWDLSNGENGLPAPFWIGNPENPSKNQFLAIWLDFCWEMA